MTNLTKTQKEALQAIRTRFSSKLEKERRRWGDESAHQLEMRGIPYSGHSNATIRALERKGLIDIVSISHTGQRVARKGPWGVRLGGTKEVGQSTTLFVRPVPQENPYGDVTNRAEKLFSKFHQFKPREVGPFHPTFFVPRQMFFVGHPTTMFYTSDKRNPSTGEDEGFIQYFHLHDRGCDAPRLYLSDHSEGGELRNIPSWISGSNVSFALIGQCDGWDFTNFDGEDISMKATQPKPRWYATSNGKALICVQDEREVLACVWGGKLCVEPRGVVG